MVAPFVMLYEPTQATQDNVTAQPPCVFELFETNLNVRQPLDEVNEEGNVLPEKVPNNGEDVFGPL